MPHDVRVALAAYYKWHHLSNSEIASRLRVDVSSVSRYITQAKYRGWLKEELVLDLPEDCAEEIGRRLRRPDLEATLISLFAPATDAEKHRGCLDEGRVVVVGAMRDIETHLTAQEIDRVYVSRIGFEGAQLLRDVLLRGAGRARTILGVTWGRTTHEVVAALDRVEPPKTPNVRVVPLQGGMGLAFQEPDQGRCYADVLAQRMSERLRSLDPPLRLSVPAFIDYQTASEAGDDGLASVLSFVRREKSFQRANEAYDSLDIGLIGIGGLEEGAWALAVDYLVGEKEVEALKQVGVCGDIVCRFYRDVVEDPVEAPGDVSAPASARDREIRDALYRANRRAIGITLRQIRRRILAGARIIGVAGGKNGGKARAIFGALVNGYVTDLVTDEITAERIVAIAEGVQE